MYGYALSENSVPPCIKKYVSVIDKITDLMKIK